MEQLTDFFKIVSDETRLRIIVLLYRGELCVCELCSMLDLSQPKVSKHLGKIRDVGLAQDERYNQWIFYRLTLKDALMDQFIGQILENIDRYPQLHSDMLELQKREDSKELFRWKK